MSTIRVVVADDHEVVRSGLRAFVDSAPGMKVVAEAANGQEAILCARELRPDVLVMDIAMPVLDGAAATERIAREFPGMKILALSAYDDRAQLVRLMNAGAAGYALKGAPGDELVRAIRTVASGGTYVDPLLAGKVLRSPRTIAKPIDVTDSLSNREEEVLRRIAWGESNKEIAEQLGISTKTVETYKARITDKLGLRTRPEMVRYAVRRGWLTEI